MSTHAERIAQAERAVVAAALNWLPLYKQNVRFGIVPVEVQLASAAELLRDLRTECCTHCHGTAEQREYEHMRCNQDAGHCGHCDNGRIRP